MEEKRFVKLHRFYYVKDEFVIEDYDDIFTLDNIHNVNNIEPSDEFIDIILNENDLIFCIDNFIIDNYFDLFETLISNNQIRDLKIINFSEDKIGKFKIIPPDQLIRVNTIKGNGKSFFILKNGSIKMNDEKWEFFSLINGLMPDLLCSGLEII